MAARNSLPVEYLRQSLREEGGRLYWLERPRDHFPAVGAWRRWNTMHAGREAGRARDENGSMRHLVHFKGCQLYRSVLVWALYYGEWPPQTMQIDHENRNSLDDRIENLRLATSSQNVANRKKARNNKSGYKGVFWNKQAGSWCARIQVNRKRKHLGFYDDPAAAHAVYVAAAKEAFGEFACDGRPR